MVEYDGGLEDWRLSGFFRDPGNLRHRLNFVIPLLVFLTSLLAGIAASAVEADAQVVYARIVAVSLFCALCALVVSLAITKPLEDILSRAGRLIRYKGKQSERGRIIDVYRLIESLMERVRKEDPADASGIRSAEEDLEKLDYLLPLGYMSLMVAHEVRNPLATITGMTELLKARLEDPRLKEYADVSLKAARRIDTFTKDLLDATERELFEEEIDIDALVRETIEAASHALSGVKWNIEKGRHPGAFFGDRNKIYQALANIIRNAFEYEAPGGEVKVRIQEGDPLRVEVFNSHSRIEAGDIEQVFKPFFTKKKGGRGIGLFVAQRNVRLHGGDIFVQSGQKGTTFTLELPRKPKGALEGEGVT
jgi:two-component system, NtrC family, sensor histidine kinase HydH